MTAAWRQLEAEIADVLRAHNFHVTKDGDSYIKFDYDFPVTFNLTTFAKELAQRLEKNR